ncbi:hypothetical protein ZTR_06016 [Talaromyces verruculosus]|nr:hypothetical protein ZTR_06016 [Talaromyces verruculosus]
MDGLKIEQLQSLQSKDQAALLDTVDEIRRHGVNRYVSLPQLIVCGDQSSGKSSVLEAISGVQFPVNDGLCTRFTTEVILRRATKSLATVKLIPAKDAPASHREKLLLFQKSSINHAEIPDLISEAKTFMGLTGSSTFSRDVLQLEVSGPRLPHLTLVDLPGLIHHPNKEQTEEDVRIPKELVQTYMSQSRSIVLAIITAKNDTSNQVVLKMAKEADPLGNRTMGIITKPDCLIKDSPNESNFFALASNKETYFKLDWHVLRNGDFNERNDSTFNRDGVEKDFFASTIWKNLPSHKRGVEALRTRLSHVLYQQIQKELPSLLKEIEAELADCKTTLDRLGSPRDTPTSRRQYLTGIAGRFLDLQFLEEIRQLLNDSKGRELPGTFTPLLVGDLFIRQSTNWKPFALDFVEDVWNIVKQFLDDVLVHVADENVREALLEEIIDPEMERILMKLKDKVAELHSPYARGSPKTLNPRFVKELESRRSQQAENPSNQPGTLLGTTINEDADGYACRELLHLMQAYYAVALDVFVDNVSSLAVENCLMNALENLLSPLTVSEMSDEELENIAFESLAVCELRSQTLEKQSSLQKSFELCRRQARKLASNRLNEVAQKEAQKKTQQTEPLPLSVTEGVAKIKITPAAPAAIPIKGSNGTLPSDSKTTGGGLFGSSTAPPSPFGSKTTAGAFGSTGGPGSMDGFGGSRGLFGRSTSPLGAKSDAGGFDSNTTGGGLGGLGSTDATAQPRAFGDVAALPQQTDTSSDANKGNAK